MDWSLVIQRPNRKQRLLGWDKTKGIINGDVSGSLIGDIDGAYGSFWLRWCKLRDSDSEHTILHGCLHFLHLCVLWELETAEEAPLWALHPVPPVARRCLLFLALTTDLQHTPVFHLHLHFLLAQACNHARSAHKCQGIQDHIWKRKVVGWNWKASS